MFVTTPTDEGEGILVAGDCTTNVAAPAIDTILTGTNLISSLYVAGQDGVSNKGEAVTVGLLATGFWLSSAIYGYYFTSKCAALKADGDQAPHSRARRLRRTILSAPPRPLPAPPPADGVGTAPAPTSPSGAETPAPPAYTPLASPPAPAAPQQQDEDDPG